MSVPFHVKSARVGLAPHSTEHAEFFYRIANMPEVTRGMRITFPITREQEKQGLERMLGEPSSGTPRSVHFAVYALDMGASETLIGGTALEGIDWINRTAVTGTMFAPEYHGKGYGTHAKMLLLSYAFHTLNLRAIESHVIEFNDASRRVQEKCGYQEVGRLPAWHLQNDSWYDEIILVVIRETWEPLWDAFVHTEC